MGKRSSQEPHEPCDRQKPPARTAKEREDEMIALAMDLAEKQLRNGTASSQVITQFLKLGSTRERLEQENKRLDNELLIAKREALESAKRIEEKYTEAIAAFRSYAGND